MGIAQIWTRRIITQANAKLNDYYFAARYTVS
jgi:hypothetical protein